MRRHASAWQRHVHVFDGRGDHLGSFPTFQAAHDWAHLQSALGGVPGPVDVEDRIRRVTRRITRERCQAITWTAEYGPDDDGGETCAVAGTLDPARSPDAYVARRAPLPREPLDAQLSGRPRGEW